MFGVERSFSEKNKKNKIIFEIFSKARSQPSYWRRFYPTSLHGSTTILNKLTAKHRAIAAIKWDKTYFHSFSFWLCRSRVNDDVMVGCISVPTSEVGQDEFDKNLRKTRRVMMMLVLLIQTSERSVKDGWEPLQTRKHCYADFWAKAVWQHQQTRNLREGRMISMLELS